MTTTTGRIRHTRCTTTWSSTSNLLRWAASSEEAARQGFRLYVQMDNVQGQWATFAYAPTHAYIARWGRRIPHLGMRLSFDHRQGAFLARLQLRERQYVQWQIMTDPFRSDPDRGR